MALANGVLGWHRNSAFSGKDGAPLTMAEGGYSRWVVWYSVQVQSILYGLRHVQVAGAVQDPRHSSRIVSTDQRERQSGLYRLLGGVWPCQLLHIAGQHSCPADDMAMAELSA